MDPLEYSRERRSFARFPETPHYYGDVVRGLFLFAGAILLLLGPSHPTLAPFGSTFIILVILVAVVLAGITNPKQRAIVLADTLISAIGLLLFAFAAISEYRTNADLKSLVFLGQEVISLCFFFALYYSVKSLRGMILK